MSSFIKNRPIRLSESTGFVSLHHTPLESRSSSVENQFLEIKNKILNVKSSKTNARSVEHFEKLLGSIDFFEKPDIVPLPWLDFDLDKGILKSEFETCETARTTQSQFTNERELEDNKTRSYQIFELENDNLKSELRKMKEIIYKNKILNTKLGRMEILENENIELQRLLHNQSERIKENYNNEKAYSEMANEINREVSRIKNELYESEKQREDLQTSYRLLSQTYQALIKEQRLDKELFKDRCNDYQYQIDENNKIITTLKSKEIEYTNIIDLSASKLNDLENELKQKDTNLQLQTKSIQDYRSVVDEMEFNINTLKSEIQNLENKLNKTEGNHVKLINEMENKLKETEKLIISQAAENKLIRQKLDDLTTKILETELGLRTNSELKFKKPKKKRSPVKLFTRLYACKKDPCDTCVNGHGHNWAKSKFDFTN